MKKESIKTLLLISLVICSMVLTTQIWFNEKLWSSDYDFFSVFKDKIVSLFKDDSEASLSIGDTGAFNSIFAPNTMLLSGNNGRVLYDSSTEKGGAINFVINDVIKEALSTKAVSEVTEDEWKNIIKSTNIYADYHVPVSVDAIGGFLEADTVKTEGFVSFDKLLIDCDKLSSTIVPVYFRDSRSNHHFRINTAFDKTKLTALFENTGEDLNLSYSFELGLDKKAEGEGSKHQNVLLDSYILLSLDETKMNTIKEEKLDILSNTDHLLESFGYNKKTVRKFTQTNGTENYIDSKSTLIIDPKGFIEYTAVLENGGLKIGEDSDITTAAAGAASLIDTILSEFYLNSSTKLFISSPLVDNGENTHTLTFSYLFDAIKINSNSPDCTVTVTDGKITYLKLNIKNFFEAYEDAPTNVLDIIEKAYTKNQSDSTLIIKDLSTGYVQYGGTYKKVWLVTTAATDEPIIIE